MSAIAISLLALILMVSGAACGFFLRRKAPPHHLSGASLDTIKLGMGLVATVAALVLGLLIASSHSAYETKRNEINQITAQTIFLDRLLAEYGAEANETRQALRQAVAASVARIWREESVGPAAKKAPFVPSATAGLIYRSIHRLSPKDEIQRSLREEALVIATTLIELRLELFAESKSPIARPFVAVIIFWLVVIFFSFGLPAQPNVTMLAVLFICAMSASTALFLILELSEPFSGVMTIPKAPLLNALAPIGVGQ